MKVLFKKAKNIIRLPRRLRKISILVLLSSIIWVVIHFLTSPVHGKIIPVDLHSAKSPTAERPQSAASTDEQAYFILSLPAGYVSQSTGTVSGNQLFSQTIIKPSDAGSLLIAIGISSLQDGGLQSDSSYQLRKNNTSQFKPSTIVVQGQELPVFGDTESTSVVAFWSHDSKFATISVSRAISNPGGDNTDEMQVLNTVLHNWRWK